MKRRETVPSEMIRPPFFMKEGGTISSDNCIFQEDILYQNGFGTEGDYPWQEPRTAVATLYKNWKEVGEPQITSCFKERNREKARPKMICYLACFIQAMTWAEGRPVLSLKNIEMDVASTPYAPMNSKERLSFILETIDHHQSFIALQQLFDEANKKWAVYFMKS
ncbi:YpoC family protein [Alteribacter populi]|uniref:YpoC family protein n=1 Tax=Alteribacter populi TaxID=2011011 RepID=UPI000BBA4B33|nr:hypothetical protein [Alteribacter populi]